MNTPGQSTVAATLDAIDAAVEQRCACGCGSPLDPDGPSAWFASPDCQRTWHERHATDPDDVYERADAAAYVGVDSAAWSLSEPGEYPYRHATAPLAYWPLSESGGVDWEQGAAEDVANWLEVHRGEDSAGRRCEIRSTMGGIAHWLTERIRADYPDFDFQWEWEPAESSGPPYTHTVSGGGAPSFSFDMEFTLSPEQSARWASIFGPQAAPIDTSALCREHAAEQVEQPPTDPMERALWLRRNRNTGPRPRQRAPRRIDPRRSR